MFHTHVCQKCMEPIETQWEVATSVSKPEVLVKKDYIQPSDAVQSIAIKMLR